MYIFRSKFAYCIGVVSVTSLCGMEAGYRSNLEEQVAEVELLQAMFPGPGELQLDPGALEEV